MRVVSSTALDGASYSRTPGVLQGSTPRDEVSFRQNEPEGGRNKRVHFGRKADVSSGRPHASGIRDMLSRTPSPSLGCTRTARRFRGEFERPTTRLPQDSLQTPSSGLGQRNNGAHDRTPGDRLSEMQRWSQCRAAWPADTEGYWILRARVCPRRHCSRLERAWNAALTQLFTGLQPQAKSPWAVSSIGGTASGGVSSRAVAEDVGSIGARWQQTEVDSYGGTASGGSLPRGGADRVPLMEVLTQCKWRQRNGNLAEVLDRIASINWRAAGVVAQRFEAPKVTGADGTWSRAMYLDLLKPSCALLASRGEKYELAREVTNEARMASWPTRLRLEKQRKRWSKRNFKTTRARSQRWKAIWCQSPGTTARSRPAAAGVPGVPSMEESKFEVLRRAGNCFSAGQSSHVAAAPACRGTASGTQKISSASKR